MRDDIVNCWLNKMNGSDNDVCSKEKDHFRYKHCSCQSIQTHYILYILYIQMLSTSQPLYNIFRANCMYMLQNQPRVLNKNKSITKFVSKLHIAIYTYVNNHVLNVHIICYMLSLHYHYII